MQSMTTPPQTPQSKVSAAKRCLRATVESVRKTHAPSIGPTPIFMFKPDCQHTMARTLNPRRSAVVSEERDQLRRAVLNPRRNAAEADDKARSTALHALQQVQIMNKGAAELVAMATGTRQTLESLHRLVENLDQLLTYVEVAPTLLHYAEQTTTSTYDTEYIWKIHKKTVQMAGEHPVAEALVDVALVFLDNDAFEMSDSGSEAVLELLTTQGRTELPKSVIDGVMLLLEHEWKFTREKAVRLLQQVDFDTRIYKYALIKSAMQVD
tara:strand:+ start:239 stop:1039 length:801 start_codon:yes stop_codon:yes gene_type:complete